MVRLKNTGLTADENAAPAATVDPAVASATLESQGSTGEANGHDNADANGESAEAAPNGESNIKAEERKYLTAVGLIGREYGTGKKALMNLAMTVTEGAQAGVIKDGKKEGHRYYKRFKENADRKAVTAAGTVIGEGASSNSTSVQVSKLRAFMKLGNHWPDDATEIVERAMEVHATLANNEQDKARLKLPSTYTALVAIAREHMKERKGVAMDEDEMREFFLGEEPKTKVGADYLIAAIKSIRQAQKGKDATEDKPLSGRDPIEDARLDQSISLLRDVVAGVDPKKFEALLETERKEAEKNGDAEDGETEAADAE